MKVLPLALALLGGVSAPGGVDIAARATRADQVHAGAAPTIRYQERVLPIRDGLPKMKDFPREFGGSGELLPE